MKFSVVLYFCDIQEGKHMTCSKSELAEQDLIVRCMVTASGIQNLRHDK